MKRAAFTMIELVFVIVILGIMASIAIPKMQSTQKSAEAQKVESFASTLNRTTFPSMYLSAVRSGGSITSMSVDKYIDLPSEIISFDISSCGDTLTDIGDTSIGAKIYCRDGNSTNVPVVSFSSTEVNTTLPSSYFE